MRSYEYGGQNFMFVSIDAANEHRPHGGGPAAALSIAD